MAGAESRRRGRQITVVEAMVYVAIGLAAVSLAGLAISATAGGSPVCTNTNLTTTICQNPGNAQVTTSPGTRANPNWWLWPWMGGGFTISIG